MSGSSPVSKRKRPNVLDRFIQQAVLQVLTPLFDPHFSESSHGFRPGRSAHGAAKQVQQIIRRGCRHVVDMDLSKFFDRVQHDVLMSRIARRVSDQRILRLIGSYLRAGVMVDGVLQHSTEGTPQGRHGRIALTLHLADRFYSDTGSRGVGSGPTAPLSPLLANILLDDFDRELEQRGLRFVRYADDFVIFTKSARSAQRVYHSVCRYLTVELRLVVNQEKSRVVETDGLALLLL